MSRGVVFNPTDPGKTLRHQTQLNPDIVTITTVAHQVQPIRHGLGRIPRGMQILKQPAGLIFSHGKETNDPADTATILYQRFSISGISLTIAIY